MLKAPPTVLTPEAIGFGFILWLVSIAAASVAMNFGKISEIWMFVVMSWPIILGVTIVKIERTLLRMRGEWSPSAPHSPAEAASPPPGADDPDVVSSSMQAAEAS